MANPKMNMTHVDLVMVYKDIVMNSKLQLLNPISKLEATPVTAIFFQDEDHGIVTRDVPDMTRNQNLTRDANRYLMIK